jgi:hypothetical protein
MVINYGMSDIGPWSLLDPSAQSGDVVMRMMARNSMSENLQQRIDDAVKKIAEEAYEVALRHIRDNRWVLRWSVPMQQPATRPICGAICDRNKCKVPYGMRQNVHCIGVAVVLQLACSPPDCLLAAKLTPAHPADVSVL